MAVVSPLFARRHQKSITGALKEADISVRRRALDLLFAMATPTNAPGITGFHGRYHQLVCRCPGPDVRHGTPTNAPGPLGFETPKLNLVSVRQRAGPAVCHGHAPPTWQLL